MTTSNLRVTNFKNSKTRYESLFLEFRGLSSCMNEQISCPIYSYSYWEIYDKKYNESN